MHQINLLHGYVFILLHIGYYYFLSFYLLLLFYYYFLISRNCHANGLSVSSDNSILSVSYGTTITFWDSNKYNFITFINLILLLFFSLIFIFIFFSVELKGSIPLLSTSSIVTHTTFIEPRKSSILGG